jgi:hypothetical protein
VGTSSNSKTDLNALPYRGSHIRTRRQFGYWHHGICISDERVIQFGGRICDKPVANIEAVSMRVFADGGQVEVVPHSDKQPFFGPIGPPGDPETTVYRAEWLVINHPPNLYNLFGWNCEHVATWCVNGLMESQQIRKVLAAEGLLIAASIAVLARTKNPPSWLRIPIWTAFGSAIVTNWAYNYFSRRWWSQMRTLWYRDHPTGTLDDCHALGQSEE